MRLRTYVLTCLHRNQGITVVSNHLTKVPLSLALPSNVAHFQGLTDIPDFDLLEPRFVFPPSKPRLRAWKRLQEVERRIDHFEWLLHIARKPYPLPRTVGDFATSYLLSFESCVQLLKKEFMGGFDQWLATQTSYDLVCRGIQTLRNLEAHIRVGGLSNAYFEHGNSRFAAGGDSGQTVAWHFSPISGEEYEELLPRGRKLLASELPDWNQLTEAHLVEELMRRGVTSLANIVKQAENEAAAHAV